VRDDLAIPDAEDVRDPELDVLSPACDAEGREVVHYRAGRSEERSAAETPSDRPGSSRP
jgi:hypothetical protein